MKSLDDITGAVVDASLKIHMGLGPGLLESVHEAVPARAFDGVRQLITNQEEIFNQDFFGTVQLVPAGSDSQELLTGRTRLV